MLSLVVNTTLVVSVLSYCCCKHLSITKTITLYQCSADHLFCQDISVFPALVAISASHHYVHHTGRVPGLPVTGGHWSLVGTDPNEERVAPRFPSDRERQCRRADRV